jgi:hypothetical protein
LEGGLQFDRGAEDSAADFANGSSRYRVAPEGKLIYPKILSYPAQVRKLKAHLYR